ncbi:hypothetical protein IT568_03730, partial [bacterium]|nr:hypothetical protein [bacterium]
HEKLPFDFERRETLLNYSVKTIVPDFESSKIKNAKTKGYTGEQCGQCSSMKVRRNGACTVCEDCGETSGCS